MSGRARRLGWRGLRAFGRDTRGAAAVEFALWAVILVAPTLNVIDFGFYIYQGMQVGEAAQAVAQTVWSQCSSSRLVTSTARLPAAYKCFGLTPDLQTAMTNAVQSTSLGTKPNLKQGTVAQSIEGFYCADTTGALHAVGATAWPLVSTTGSAPTPPATCTPYSTATPGDYVQILVRYAYTPVFPGVTLAGALGPIVRTAWMRLSYD
jgi:Flp pilus assembly protein TadG